MKKLFAISLILVACGNRTDAQEVKIGTQTWATKNLDIRTFRNGDSIPEAKTNEEWIAAAKQGKPACCYYHNDLANGSTYGKLYNWYAVNDPRGLAPEGFHIPNHAEWTRLTDFLGGKEKAGEKMKSTSGWKESGNGNGTNANDFAGLPGGFRDDFGSFGYIGFFGYWWSSMEAGPSGAWSSQLYYQYHYLGWNDFVKPCGLSVRCLKD